MQKLSQSTEQRYKAIEIMKEKTRDLGIDQRGLVYPIRISG